ncbi:hypothetical protein UPYG_G00053990 [Umbra pygmaea]|uniref:NACHT domain-containing protein n=1 Tax=Umbra pygmaea TaxID=75934 RepID=A0ABD0XV93_UMBPY
MAQPVTPQYSIKAQGGSVVVTPQLTGCSVEGSIHQNITVNMSSHGAEAVVPGIVSCSVEDLQKAKDKHKSNMKKKYGSIFEGLGKRGNPTLLNQIYTELYITTGESEGVNREHEVWDIEDMNRIKEFQDKTIKCCEIFRSFEREKHDKCKQDAPIRNVLTKGIAGIGKTVSVQKFILDWAEGKANQDVDFVFALPFRDLNLVKDDQYSLLELLNDFYPALTDMKDPKKLSDCKVLFIFDGLDESQLVLNFNKKRLSNLTKQTTVDILLTNLLNCNMLPEALIWITSRPAAVDQIPAEYFDRVTEVRGFNDAQKEEYFKKQFCDDENLASRTISHIKTSRTLHIMCHIPVFCWITAMVLGKMLRQNEQGKIPKSLSEMYIRFLLTLTDLKNKKYHVKNETDPRHLSESDVQLIFQLGKLAFKNLEKSNLVFSEDDLKECGIDINSASLLSGICTEIFREEDPMFNVKKYSFVHFSFQEFFGALYVAYLFVSENVNPFQSRENRYFKDSEDDDSDDKYFRGSEQQNNTLHDLQRSAVDEALRSKTGHLDLFLRFLLGISLESNQILLKSLQLQTEGDKESITKTIQHIKNRLSDKGQRLSFSPERCINLFHCLIELNDSSFMEEIQMFLTTRNSAETTLTPAQCSALAYIFLMSEEGLDTLDLREYNTSSDGRQRLVPAVQCCRRAVLVDCQLSSYCFKTVASALKLPNSRLRELDLSFHGLIDTKALSIGLGSPNCRLESLNLSQVNLAMPSGADLLNAVLMGPHNQPYMLRLAGCELKGVHCETIASSLQLAGSCLTELDLSYNNVTDTGVKQISQGLMSPHCKLKILRLTGCKVTDESCGVLSSALAVSLLEELCLSSNKIGDSGAKLISSGMMSPHCKIKKLRLRECDLSRCSCASLAPLLWSYSVLRELDLSDNNLWHTGIKLLSVGLRNTNCALQTLRLSGCLVTEKGCASLVSALRLNPSNLKELDLSYNHPGDSGVTLLSAGLEDPTWRLEKLNFDHVGECRIKPGLEKYACQLKLNWTSAGDVTLSEGNTRAVRRKPIYTYPYFDFSDSDDSDHTKEPEKWTKLHCQDTLSDGRFYWQVEWIGCVVIGVKYRPKWDMVGKSSWKLLCCKEQYGFVHAQTISMIAVPRPDSRCIGVYLDFPAGTLSFYSVTSGTLTHLYTCFSVFTEPLYPCFEIMCDDRELFGSIKIQNL